jgi:hypothetical protein
VYPNANAMFEQNKIISLVSNITQFHISSLSLSLCLRPPISLSLTVSLSVSLSFFLSLSLFLSLSFCLSLTVSVLLYLFLSHFHLNSFPFFSLIGCSHVSSTIDKIIPHFEWLLLTLLVLQIVERTHSPLPKSDPSQ